MSQSIPRVNVLGLSLPKIILGFDTFQCYTAFYPQPREKERLYRERFSDITGVVEVVSAAAGMGVDVLGYKRFSNLVEAVDKVRDSGVELTLIPMIYQVPLELDNKTVQVDRIEATLLSFRDSMKKERTYDEYFSTEEYLRAEQTRPLSKEEVAKLRISEEELRRLLEWYSKKGCAELVTTCVEFYALTGRLDLLESLAKTCGSYGFDVCPGSHLSGAFDLLREEKFHFPVYYATFNKTGFLMLPSQESMLRALSRMNTPIIAIKPFAGGRIPPQEAFEYIFNLKDNVICMVGLASVSEVEEAISAARDALRQGAVR